MATADSTKPLTKPAKQQVDDEQPWAVEHSKIGQFAFSSDFPLGGMRFFFLSKIGAVFTFYHIFLFSVNYLFYTWDCFRKLQ